MVETTESRDAEVARIAAATAFARVYAMIDGPDSVRRTVAAIVAAVNTRCRTIDPKPTSRDSEVREGLEDAHAALASALLWLDGEYAETPRQEFNRPAWAATARRGLAALVAARSTGAAVPAVPEDGRSRLSDNAPGVSRDSEVREAIVEAADYIEAYALDRPRQRELIARLRAILDRSSESVPTPADTALSAEEEAKLRRDHFQGALSARCWECEWTWPCPTAKLLARIAELEGALRRAETAMDNFFAATDHYIWNEHDLQYLRAVTAARAALGSSAKAVSGAEPECIVCHQPKAHDYHRKHGRSWDVPYHPFYPRVGAVSGEGPEPPTDLREVLERMSANAVRPDEYEDYYLVRRADFHEMEARISLSPPSSDADAKDEAVRRALLYVLQLSNAENDRLNATGGQRFIAALEQDGFTVTPSSDAGSPIDVEPEP